MDLSQIAAEVTAAAEELIAVAKPKEGRIFVLGCSTSEVLGSQIGTARSPETAETIINAVLAATRSHGLFLAVQCCEHLNRALVVEEDALERFGLTEVTVHPVPEAGGSAASRAYELFDRPVVVESVTADLGLDIGASTPFCASHRRSGADGGPYPSASHRGRESKIFLIYVEQY